MCSFLFARSTKYNAALAIEGACARALGTVYADYFAPWGQRSTTTSSSVYTLLLMAVVVFGNQEVLKPMLSSENTSPTPNRQLRLLRKLTGPDPPLWFLESSDYIPIECRRQAAMCAAIGEDDGTSSERFTSIAQKVCGGVTHSLSLSLHLHCHLERNLSFGRLSEPSRAEASVIGPG